MNDKTKSIPYVDEKKRGYILQLKHFSMNMMKCRQLTFIEGTAILSIGLYLFNLKHSELNSVARNV